jgi:tRNA(fMet)-specific endonuclease VapC
MARKNEAKLFRNGRSQAVRLPREFRFEIGPQTTPGTSPQTVSMRFLLDTNACIAIINGKPTAVRERVQKELRAGAEIQLSSIALFELWYGVSKSGDVAGNTRKLQFFLAGPATVLVFDEDDAVTAGEIRASSNGRVNPSEP